MFLRVVALLLILPAYCAQAQYKWTDRNGQIGYGDQAPKDAIRVERLGQMASGADAGDALAQLPFEIRQAARNFPVVLYASSNCPPCDDGRAFLKSHAIPFTERTIATRQDIEAFRLLGGGEQLPAIAVGRRILPAFDASAWGDALANAGYPQGIPLPRTWQWPAAAPLAPAAPAAPPAAEGSADAQN